MDEFAAACIILLPFLVLYSVIGGAVELYHALKDKQQDKPDLYEFPLPKRKGKEFGDELDDFICKEDEGA